MNSLREHVDRSVLSDIMLRVLRARLALGYRIEKSLVWYVINGKIVQIEEKVYIIFSIMIEKKISKLRSM